MAIGKSNVYKPIERSQNLTEKVIFTRGLWSDATGELLTFYTSSTQNSSSKEYYYQVWLSSSSACNDQSVFSIAYGHISGSGSLNSGGESSDTPSRAIYSQYRLICLDPNETTFKHKDSSSTRIEHFYAINFDRVKLGDKLDPGNFEISIAELSGSDVPNNQHTGSRVVVSGSNPKILSLIDDSSDATDTMGYGGIPSNVRALVSGTIDGGIYNPSSPQYYGLVYPDLGTIILDASVLNISASFNTVTGSNIAGDNAMKLFKSVSGSAVKGSGFTARSVDIKEQDYYFVRVYNQDFNYSNNPTYISKSTDLAQGGKLSNTKFQYEPVTYITSVGLFNDKNELLAIAKMSKPIQKSFSGELSITVKLEY